jgi:hypothetical protein
MGRIGNRVEYAAHINASPAYDTKLGKQGRLVLVEQDGRQMVDFDATDAKVRSTTNLGRAANGVNGGGAGAASGAGSTEVGDLFRKAQTQERAFSARLLELKFRRESGALVPIDDVRAAYARRIAGMREALLQIPARLAPVLAAEGDESKVHDLLQDELYLVLEQVAT